MKWCNFCQWKSTSENSLSSIRLEKTDKILRTTFSKLNHFPENAMCKAVLDRTQLSHGPRSLFPGVFVEIIISNCIILWLPEMTDSCWD